MKKIFIYYSLTGNGDSVANYLKKKGFDIQKIEVKKPLPKNFILSIIVGGYKAMVDYHEELINFNNDLNSYDEIWIGSPLWNSRLSTPVSTALKELDLTNKKVTFVLYSGSGKIDKIANDLNEKYKCNIINLTNPLNNIDEFKKIG